MSDFSMLNNVMLPKPKTRLYQFTDDLTQWQLVNLIAYMLEFGASYETINTWRQRNELPVG